MALAKTASQIGTRLKVARINAGLTQAEAAEKIGIESITLSRWERGAQRPKMDAVVELGRVYGVPLSELGGDEARLGENVPRGSAPPVDRQRGDALRDLRLAQNDVERDLINLGASDELLEETSRLFAEMTRAVREVMEHARAGTRPESLRIMERLTAEPAGDAGSLADENEKPRTPGKAAGAKPTGRQR